jgi:uncharacterized damage-inducible protein DinB
MTAGPTDEPANGPTGDPAGAGAGAGDDLDLLVDRLAAAQDPQDAQGAGSAAFAGPTGDPGASAADARPEPPAIAGEVGTLLGFLEFLRATVRWKVQGLTDEQASARLVGSETTVTGVVRHLADTERYWFREIVGGVPSEEVGYTWSDGHEATREWAVQEGDTLEAALADYVAAQELARAQMHGREPDEELRAGNEARTVRWVLIHMVEETARHAGHLDLLAELLDGRTGE